MCLFTLHAQIPKATKVALAPSVISDGLIALAGSKCIMMFSTSKFTKHLSSSQPPRSNYNTIEIQEYGELA